MTLYLDITKC